MDYLKIAEEVWRRELATHAYALNGDVAGARADTAADLIHVTVNGHCGGPEVYLDMVAGGGGVRHQSITAGPGEALVLSSEAVLVTYPIAARLTVNGLDTLVYEQASVLWMKRGGDWQTVFIHATPMADPSPRFAAAAANGRLVDVLFLADDEHRGRDGGHAGRT